MGQIERYGLYVLVLVIFLILGVAIWGDDSHAGNKTPKTDLAVREQLEQTADEMSEQERSISDALRGQFRTTEYEEEPEPKKAETVDVVMLTEADLLIDDGGALPEAPAKVEPPKPSDRILELPDLRKHKVRKGETLTEIAKDLLGSAKDWQRIVALNPHIDPGKLSVGEELLIPHDKSTMKAHLESVRRHGGRYEVVRGDSLSKISKRLLGSTRYVEAIRKANGMRDASRLSVGDVLVIPAVEID